MYRTNFAGFAFKHSFPNKLKIFTFITSYWQSKIISAKNKIAWFFNSLLLSINHKIASKISLFVWGPASNLNISQKNLKYIFCLSGISWQIPFEITMTFFLKSSLNFGYCSMKVLNIFSVRFSLNSFDIFKNIDNP